MRSRRLLPFFAGVLFSLFFNCAVCQNPGAHWQQYKSVEQAGFSGDKLREAKKYYDSLQSSAFIIVQSGKMVAAWGDVNRRFRMHSVRKPLLNSLYGIYVANGIIDTNLAIGQIPITDKDTLSALEQSAKIIHLLRSRSGVYHRAAAEPAWVKEFRPARNSHPPDSFFFYNNWDFNVLGSIFKKFALTSVFKALYDHVAVPLQMEEYRIMDGEDYYEREYSDHPAYHVKMSARDLARYGQLYLQKGSWNGRQIVPQEWVETSTYPHSKHGGGTQIGRWFGYLWGVSEYFSRYGMYFASGVGGQFLAVFPTEELILVNLNDTYRGRKVLDRELTRLFDLILAAKTGRPFDNPELIPLESRSRIPEDTCSERIDHSRYVGTWAIDGRRVSIVELGGDLVIKDFDQNFRLFPVSPGRFLLEDIEMHLNADLDGGGSPTRFYYDEPGEQGGK